MGIKVLIDSISSSFYIIRSAYPIFGKNKNIEVSCEKINNTR